MMIRGVSLKMSRLTSFISNVMKPENVSVISNYLTCLSIHRLFQLPVEHEGKSATYWSLPKPSQKVMKNTLCHVKVFIIHDISMVSSLNLAYIHMRLEELFGGGEWFGSRNVLFVGNLLQLQPVSGNPVFERFATKMTAFQTWLCNICEHLERVAHL